MFSSLKYFSVLLFLWACSSVKKQVGESGYMTEEHRPQLHFTPPSAWMNDPNGMFFHKGKYHLFYQHNPDSTVWGPMHWGHATSTDLVNWEHQPIALYPDSLGTIFSGSAVVDLANTSGFGSNGQTPVVAIFTHHNEKMEKEGRTDFQTQSIAYSLDDGKTWVKYAGNPVVKNPGIRDFRDPKIMWHEDSKRWIMTLATLDRITFYSSPNLKDWTRESEFGKEVGAHGGVWECPDLFPLEHNGEKVWVLMVSINPGGPNGGSATQYFTGRFDGKTFTPLQTDTRWIDYGPDDYAGVTWSGTGQRKVFMGWMSNWQYAGVVPTKRWRSAMTLPRDLALEKLGDRYFVTSKPVPELKALSAKSFAVQNIDAGDYDLSAQTAVSGPGLLEIKSDQIADFTITLSNGLGQNVVIGYDKKSNSYFADRTASGNTSFEKGFANRHAAPRLSTQQAMDVTLVIDNASIEVFADDGLSVMAQIFFPGEVFSKLRLQSPDHFKVRSLQYTPLKSISQKVSGHGRQGAQEKIR